MARKPNLNSGDFKKFKKKQSALATQTPLSSTAVERGSTRWLDGSTVYIEGLLDVTGTTTISGALNVSGNTTLSGATTIAGPTGITGALTIAGSTDITGPLTVQGITTISGELNVTGPTTLAGTLDITGETTLAANLNVTAGGKITAGQTVIEPTGKATFGTFIIDPSSDRLIQAPGGWLFTSGPDSLGLASSDTSSVNLNSSYAELNYLGSSTVRAEAGRISLNAPRSDVNGNLFVTGFINVTGTSVVNGIANFTSQLRNTGRLTTGNAANVHMNTGGYFYEVTSSARFKLDVQPLELPDSLLDVPVVDWVDRGAQETYDLLNTAPRPFEFEDQVAFDNADLSRIPGALAEDVVAAGGERFVTFGNDGLPRALSYDRYALARTQLLAQRLNAALRRISALENPAVA